MKFTSTRYPQLKVRRKNGKYLQAVDGVFDVKSKADQEMLNALPADRGVRPMAEAPAPAPVDNDGGPSGTGDDTKTE
ncbi:hypothetical protein [Glycomyces tarimensis]